MALHSVYNWRTLENALLIHTNVSCVTKGIYNWKHIFLVVFIPIASYHVLCNAARKLECYCKGFTIKNTYSLWFPLQQHHITGCVVQRKLDSNGKGMSVHESSIMLWSTLSIKVYSLRNSGKMQQKIVIDNLLDSYWHYRDRIHASEKWKANHKLPHNCFHSSLYQDAYQMYAVLQAPRISVVCNTSGSIKSAGSDQFSTVSTSMISSLRALSLSTIASQMRRRAFRNIIFTSSRSMIGYSIYMWRLNISLAYKEIQQKSRTPDT